MDTGRYGSMPSAGAMLMLPLTAPPDLLMFALICPPLARLFTHSLTLLSLKCWPMLPYCMLNWNGASKDGGAPDTDATEGIFGVDSVEDLSVVDVSGCESAAASVDGPVPGVAAAPGAVGGEGGGRTGRRRTAGAGAAGDRKSSSSWIGTSPDCFRGSCCTPDCGVSTEDRLRYELARAEA